MGHGPKQLDTYIGCLTARQGTSLPILRLGLEVDWIPEQEEKIRETLSSLPLDYVIGSVHEVDGFSIDMAASHWDALPSKERDEVHRRYWEQLAAMARSQLFDIAGHIDVSRKFGHWPTVELQDEIDTALQAMAESGMVVELNTAGWHMPCRDGYPTLEILRACSDRGIKATLSADAHDPAHLLRDFPRGLKRLQEAGYDEIARFEKRRISCEAIACAALPSQLAQLATRRCD